VLSPSAASERVKLASCSIPLKKKEITVILHVRDVEFEWENAGNFTCVCQGHSKIDGASKTHRGFPEA
jgi:hypothetical protein